MPRQSLLFACLTLTTSLAWAADGPSTPQPATPASADSPPAAPTSAPTRATAAVATPDRVYAGGLTNPEIEHAFRKFSKRVVDGEMRYCRRETPLGTRLGASVCYSAEQVLEMARAEREAGEELQRKRDLTFAR
jgi:hypothetical protein